MINLAPDHKMGLEVANPVLLAGGVVGYGEAIAKGLDLSKLGGVVIGPFALRSRAGRPPPRLAETIGGCVLTTGMQSRGLSAIVRHFARSWPKLGAPVVAQLVDIDAEDLARVASRLADLDGISGLELLVPPQMSAGQLSENVQAVEMIGDLPVWVKLPLERATELAAAGAEGGASAVVIGQPPTAALPTDSSAKGDKTEQTMVPGHLFGPLSFALMMVALESVVAANLPCPVIACGGIHTLAQAEAAIATGASALQLDSAVWIEPGFASHLVEALA